MVNINARALLVDDDALFCKHGFVPLAREAGLDVTVAMTRAEGLAALEQQLFGIVYADLHLPDGTGCALIDKAVAQSVGGRPYCIAVSGTRDVHETNEAWRSGARDFLVKPFAPKEFRRVLARAQDALSTPPPSLPPWIARFVTECCSTDVIAMLAARYQGKLNRQIAPRFGITESGLKQRFSKELFAPLGATRLSELDSAARAWFEEQDRG